MAARKRTADEVKAAADMLRDKDFVAFEGVDDDDSALPAGADASLSGTDSSRDNDDSSSLTGDSPITDDPPDQEDESSDASPVALKDFRKLQSKLDKRLAQERQQRERAEKLLQEQQENTRREQMRVLQSQVSQAKTPAERDAYNQQLIELRAYEMHQQWSQWDRYKAGRLEEAGFSPTDPRFSKQYVGEPGLMQFQLDVAEAQLEAERSKREDAERRAADVPTLIQKQVREQVAKFAHEAGFTIPDPGGDAGAKRSRAAGADLEQAMDDFNQGRITYQVYKQRTGG